MGLPNYKSLVYRLHPDLSLQNMRYRREDDPIPYAGTVPVVDVGAQATEEDEEAANGDSVEAQLQLEKLQGGDS